MNKYKRTSQVFNFADENYVPVDCTSVIAQVGADREEVFLFITGRRIDIFNRFRKLKVHDWWYVE